jgi:hypothetical protein
MSEIKTPPRRLLDLSPQWLPTPEVAFAHGLVERSALEFDCPCGEKCGWSRIYLPITGRSEVGGVTWELKGGDDFATVTLSPSIHAVGHWHGWLRNGVLESV